MVRSMRTPSFALLALAAALAGCGGGGAPATERTVVAAFYPLAWAAERMAGPETEVVDLTPAGVEPHDLELTARDVERVRGAALVFYLGGGFMPALEEAVRGQPRAVDLLESVDLLTWADGHEDDGHEDGGREDGGHEDDGHGGREDGGHEDGGREDGGRGQPIDPHVWLDPGRFAAVVRAMADALGDPAAADAVAADLRELDREYRQGLARCERREIVTSHAAFAYLADAYDLRQIALAGLSPEAEPGPRALERLVAEVEETGATTVFFETLVSPRVAETVAREAGVSTAALDPLEGLTRDLLEAGEDYLSVMRRNLETLRRALGCR